jgi:hypothetical protein
VTFKEFLQSETTGSVAGLARGQWPDDAKNGQEFKARGVRSKYDGGQAPLQKPNKTPEDVLGIDKFKKLSGKL